MKRRLAKKILKQHRAGRDVGDSRLAAAKERLPAYAAMLDGKEFAEMLAEINSGRPIEIYATYSEPVTCLSLDEMRQLCSQFKPMRPGAAVMLDSQKKQLVVELQKRMEYLPQTVGHWSSLYGYEVYSGVDPVETLWSAG